MASIEIKRGYEVLPDNNVRFGIRIANTGDVVISDVEVILDYSESYSGADISAICKEAAGIPLGEAREIEEQDFVKVLEGRKLRRVGRCGF